MTKENNSNAAETSSTGIPDWMMFPTIAEIFDQSPSDAIAHMSAKCKEYQSRSVTASAMDHARDRLIAESYSWTCALLEHLEEQRQNILRKEATTGQQTR